MGRQTALNRAEWSGNIDTLNVLLQNSADVNAQDNLRHAGHKSALIALLKNGADVKAQDDIGETVLHYAARRGYNDIVDVVLESGADVEGPEIYEQRSMNMHRRMWACLGLDKSNR